MAKNKMAKCDVCGKSFITKSHLRQHMVMHTGEKKYECNQCDKKFARSQELKLHINYHLGIKPFHCKLCPKQFSQPAHLKAHLRTHTGEKPFACPLCPKRFTQSSHLRSHQLHHSGDKPHKCRECGAAFRLSSTLKCHLRRHTGEKPYKCHICGMAFSQTTPLYSHLLKHSNKMPFKCRHCGKGFQTKTICRDHESTVCISGGRRRFRCVFCKDKCYTSQELDRHIRMHIKETPYFCRFCDLCFISVRAKRYHMRIHLDSGTGAASVKEKPFKCQLCHHSFAEEERFKRHLNQNHLDVEIYNGEEEDGDAVEQVLKEDKAKISCGSCSASFNSVGEFREHNIKEHLFKKMVTWGNVNNNKMSADGGGGTGGRCNNVKVEKLQKQKMVNVKKNTFKCKQCEHSFSADLKLALHVKLVHEELTPIPCSLCWKRFPSETALAVHLKVEHKRKVKREAVQRKKEQRKGGEAIMAKIKTEVKHEGQQGYPGDDADKDAVSLNVGVTTVVKEEPMEPLLAFVKVGVQVGGADSDVGQETDVKDEEEHRIVKEVLNEMIDLVCQVCSRRLDNDNVVTAVLATTLNETAPFSYYRCTADYTRVVVG